MIDPADPRWHKSTYSGTGDGCVEAAELPGVVAVRDSKNRNGPVLAFSTAEWRTFTDQVKDGEHTDTA